MGRGESTAAASLWAAVCRLLLLVVLGVSMGAALPSHAKTVAAAQARAKTAAPEEPPALKERCLACHDDPQMKSDDGKSLAVLADDFNRSAHRKRDCSDCHADALTVKHPRNKLGPVNPQVCQQCHADEFKAIAGSVHGRRAGGAKAINDCTSCHGSLHRVLRDGDPNSPLSPINQIRTCGRCHDDVVDHYEKSEHARALLKAGLVESAPSCASCHGKHDIRPKDDPASRTSHTKIPETCGKCHQAILLEWQDSAHGAVWRKAESAPLGKNGEPVKVVEKPKGGDGASEGPVCTTCHEPHAIRRPDSAVVRDQVAGRCGNCHQKVYATFRDSFHGKSSSLDNVEVAVCADCHTAHHNLPASDPRSTINPANLAKTCGKCHQDVNASFLTFDPHANPADPKRNPYVHWIYVAMTSLLIGVFAFFGLHGLLWLQRAVVGRIRGEFVAGHHSPTGQYVRRFRPQQIAMHITVVVSFLVLSATGLPLKFAEAPWAHDVMAFFGGAAAARVLHHLAGVVTFGYLIAHVATVAWETIVKKERGFFWGPRSMVPQPRDIADMFRMFRYFLYLGPRPKFDRFTYWEKFDYLAVFWGVGMIGVSGLVLWMPTLATKVIPGWALNAAYVIHSDEALLATGFIFLFHFFHTHLRPEAFPLDPVVFVGRMPLERFKEERPLEYERAVASGTLEQMMMPPPTTAQMRHARIFGFTALTIGVVLAFCILWALVGGFE